MIVARLIQAGKLAGFHFNDSKYGDDDLDAGSIKPFQLFLIFNELVDAELARVPGFTPAYMLDQSHNVTDPDRVADDRASSRCCARTCRRTWWTATRSRRRRIGATPSRRCRC